MISQARWPFVIAGTGGVLNIIFLGELGLVATGVFSPPEGFLPGIVTSVPFLIGLVYGGYWLAESDMAPARYQRVGWWYLSGMLLFTLMIIGVVLFLPTLTSRTWLFFLGAVRWSASIGAGAGLLIGVFEARAITQALAVERYRLKQEATQRERDQLEKFANIVSHDLRNPLHTLTMRMELLQEECESEHIEQMEQTVERMDTIIEDTLTLARQGQAVSETAPVELERIARDSWTVTKTGGASLQIKDSIEFLADESRLRHVFENLFRNAHTHGGDDVTVWVGTIEDRTGFYVEDTGPGIPADRCDAVFEPGETTASAGSGLGLTIVREIVEAHEWEVTVTEGRRGGARFEITQVDVAAE